MGLKEILDSLQSAGIAGTIFIMFFLFREDTKKRETKQEDRNKELEKRNQELAERVAVAIEHNSEALDSLKDLIKSTLEFFPRKK